MNSPDPQVILQRHHDGEDGVWFALEQPQKILHARRLDEVRPLLVAAEAAALDGAYVGGFLAYEAAAAFDEALVTHPPQPDFPLAWFGVFAKARRLDAPPFASEADPFSAEWTTPQDAASYAECIDRIHAYIAAGDGYQVNFTYRLHSHFEGNPRALQAQLIRGQQALHQAYLDTGTHWICSASPELFFRRRGGHLTCRPMKGTRPRGRTPEEDQRFAQQLRSASKDRAENIMIVDMIRNDLGRIAKPGTVRVTRTFETEAYPTLWQMTSTVEAESQASLDELFAALYPCASITGAPKVRTMEIIRELESSPRGLYTGCIGSIFPDGSSEFNVAIRTACIEQAGGDAHYGSGSGIVWDSVACDEFEECQTKTRVLQRPDAATDYQLLETLRWEPGEGFSWLEAHLQRLQASARQLGFACDLEALRQQMNAALPTIQEPPVQRVRLLLDARGMASLSWAPLKDVPPPWTVALDHVAVNSADESLRHKTTRRATYEAAAARHPDCREVILINQRGELTETTLGNLVLEMDGQRLTPPLHCGLLPGTFRAALLEKGEIEEATLTPDDLDKADRIWMINSVRGWVLLRR